MRRGGLVVGGLLLGGLLACRARATSTTQPSDSQLEDERTRVSRGEDVGASLQAPEIEVDGAGLRVDSLDVVTFVESDRRTFDVTTWRGMDRCSVIMVRDSEVDPAKLPVR